MQAEHDCTGEGFSNVASVISPAETGGGVYDDRSTIAVNIVGNSRIN